MTRVSRINPVPATDELLQPHQGAGGAISNIPSAVRASVSPSYGTHSAVPADRCGKPGLPAGYTRDSHGRPGRNTVCSGDGRHRPSRPQPRQVKRRSAKMHPGNVSSGYSPPLRTYSKVPDRSPCSLVKSAHSLALSRVKALTLPENPGFKVNAAFFVHRVADLDGIAAHLTILDIRLPSHRCVQYHRDLFPAVRTREEVFHELRPGYLRLQVAEGIISGCNSPSCRGLTSASICSKACAMPVTSRSGWLRSKRAWAFSVSPLNPQIPATSLIPGKRPRTCLQIMRAGANA